jgi:hypothetical protein
MIKGMMPPTAEPVAWRFIDMVIYEPRSFSSEYDIAIYPIVTYMSPADTFTTSACHPTEGSELGVYYSNCHTGEDGEALLSGVIKIPETADIDHVPDHA